MLDNVDPKDAQCLNGWPKGTVGYESEKFLIETLINLMNKHGYGRVPQICSQLKEIWYDSKKIKEYEEFRKTRIEMIMNDLEAIRKDVSEY